MTLEDRVLHFRLVSFNVPKSWETSAQPVGSLGYPARLSTVGRGGWSPMGWTAFVPAVRRLALAGPPP